MSLRTMLGVDAERVHEQVDALLDSEDAMILLIDGSRAINYAKGFGISPVNSNCSRSTSRGRYRSVAGSAIKKQSRHTHLARDGCG